MDAFTLKLIAIISMGVHHAAMVLWQIVPMWIHIPLYLIRGVTFPIMAFFVVEGFRRTRNVKKYMLRLLIFGLISQVPYALAFGTSVWAPLNIVFAILLGLICLVLREKLYVEQGKKALFVILFILILIFATVAVEGAFAGILMIFLFCVIKEEMTRRTVPLIIWGAFMVFGSVTTRLVPLLMDTLGVYVAEAAVEMTGILAYMNMMSQYFLISIGTFLIIPLLRSYNGELGKRAKYLFYTFYPLHFVILVIIGVALGLITVTNAFPLF